MNKLNLVPPAPPKANNGGRIAWSKEQEEFLVKAFGAGVDTPGKIQKFCGGAWKSVPSDKLSRKIQSLGLKKTKKNGIFH